MRRSILYAALVSTLLIAGATHVALAQSSALPALACASPTGPFVQTNGTDFTVNGQPFPVRGYTFYPAAAGGTAAWRSLAFQAYEDTVLTVGASGGQNTIRPTDYWDKTNTHQSAFDPTIWANMDHLVCQAAADHAYVIMDLSAYKWLLLSQGKDPSNATNWTAFLAVIAQHYANATSILTYSIVGEPQFPTTQTQDDALTTFYRVVTDVVAANDAHHLISAGGFNNMNNGLAGWWKPIYALPHNDVASYKTYSQHDLDYMPTITAYTHSINKPALDEEFGMPQGLGDSTPSGQNIHGITTSRAQFFANVYGEGIRLGAAGFIFWNLANQSGPTHYDVYPGTTPAVWQVVTANGVSGTNVPPPPLPTPPLPTPTMAPPSRATDRDTSSDDTFLKVTHRISWPSRI